MMKKSKYNYSFEYKNKYYIYNPYSGLCQLGEKAYEYYNESINSHRYEHRPDVSRMVSVAHRIAQRRDEEEYQGDEE